MQSPTIEKANELLKGRLADINSERSRIERALAALAKTGGRVGRPKATATPAKRTRTSKRRKRSGGTRAVEAVKLIVATPNITASDIAKAMKIKPNYLYRVLADLEKQNLVHKKGRTYTSTSKGDALAAS